jgi:hypothetical protein
VVGSFISDPAERARWACLRELQALVLREVSADNLAWDGALASGITAIDPAHVCPASDVFLRGKPSVQDPGSLRVVFASAGRDPLAAKGTLSGGAIQATVPQGATTGWLGYTDDVILRAANGLRASLRKVWS